MSRAAQLSESRLIINGLEHSNALLRAELAAREAADTRMVALGFGGIDAALQRIGELEAELREAAEILDHTYSMEGEYVDRAVAFIAKWGTKGDAE